MIVVDTSAIIAIVWREADEAEIRAKLEAGNHSLISAPTVLELQAVLTRAGGTNQDWTDVTTVFDRYWIEVRAFDERQLLVAREAVRQFGRGKHKAALNFGDCFAYALAKSEGLPLLCKGDDFRHTDIQLA